MRLHHRISAVGYRSYRLLIGGLLLICLMALSAVARADGQKWALLIGIDEYQEHNYINRLGGAAADARALGRTLVDIAGFPESHVRLLVSDADPKLGEATPERGAILRELAQLSQKVQPGDTVIVAYSGHGVEVKDVPYLLPYDTDVSSDANLIDTSIAVETFVDRLKQVHASTLLLIFDMCRSDPHKGAKDVATPNTLKAEQKEALRLKGGEATTVVTLFACSPNQRSYEWPEKRRGYFSYFLDEGLHGRAADSKGVVRLDHLMQYVAENVEKTVHRQENRTQIPFCDVQSAAGAVDLVLARDVSPDYKPHEVEAKTEKIDTEAVFRISVNPTDAEVTIDGMPLEGRAARIDLGLEKEKTVKIAVQASGYKSEEREVTLKRGLNPPVSFLLESLNPQNEDAAPPVRHEAPPSRPVPVRPSAPARVGNGGRTVTYGVTQRQVPVSTLELIVEPGAAATPRRTLEDGEAGLKVTITGSSFRESDVRVVYRPDALQEGSTYRVRFRVRASAPRTITIACASREGQEIGYIDHFDLTTDWQLIDFTFRATGVSPRFNLAPVLLLGKDRGDVWISGVTVEEQQ